MEVSDESGQRFENEDVAEQFLKHFKKNMGTKDSVKRWMNIHCHFWNKIDTSWSRYYDQGGDR